MQNYSDGPWVPMPPVPPYTVWISASVRFLFDQAAASQHQRTINKSSLFFSQLLFFFSQMPHMKFWGVFYLVSHVLNFLSNQSKFGDTRMSRMPSGQGEVIWKLIYCMVTHRKKQTIKKKNVLFYLEGCVSFRTYLYKVRLFCYHPIFTFVACKYYHILWVQALDGRYFSYFPKII